MERLTEGQPHRKAKSIGVVIPVHNEESNLQTLHQSLQTILRRLVDHYLIIFADDGSSDRTPELIESLRAKDPQVGTVRLSRNFGHQSALMAGLDRVDTEVVIAMDGDLQHPPELIPKLYDAWRKGSDVVLTRRLDDENVGLSKKMTSRLFYHLFQRLTNVQVEAGTADFFLIDHNVCVQLRECRESTRFHRGLLPWLGFDRHYIDYVPEIRQSGESKYTLKKMLTLAMDGICGFSIVPLRISGILGLISVLCALGYMAFAITCRLIGVEMESGWTSLVSIIVFLAGMQLTILWVHGEYLARVFLETRNRPPYVVRDEIIPSPIAVREPKGM